MDEEREITDRGINPANEAPQGAPGEASPETPHSPEESPEEPPEEPDDEWLDDLPLPKAEILERYIAKAVDFLIAGAILESFTYVGPVAAIVYVLIADAMLYGRSPGKRLAGLKVISPVRRAECDFMESAVRNALFALLIAAYVIVGAIPYVGKFVVIAAALVVVAVEAIIVYNDEKGIRFGDRLAKTMVVKA